MKRPRTSKFVIATMSPEERTAHFKAVAHRSRERNREADNARRRARYAADPEAYLQKQQVRIAKDPERRRATVRKSRHRKVWLRLFNSTCQNAKRRGLEFSLTKEWMEANQTDTCQLTGIPFMKTDGTVASERGPKPLSPSLDRVDARRGYHPDNCIFVLWAVNKFKDDMPLDDMYHLAEQLLAYRPKVLLPPRT